MAAADAPTPAPPPHVFPRWCALAVLVAGGLATSSAALYLTRFTHALLESAWFGFDTTGWAYVLLALASLGIHRGLQGRGRLFGRAGLAFAVISLAASSLLDVGRIRPVGASGTSFTAHIGNELGLRDMGRRLGELDLRLAPPWISPPPRPGLVWLAALDPTACVPSDLRDPRPYARGVVTTGGLRSGPDPGPGVGRFRRAPVAGSSFAAVRRVGRSRPREHLTATQGSPRPPGICALSQRRPVENTVMPPPDDLPPPKYSLSPAP